MVYKILVVDDEIDTLRLVGLMLERQGYEIVAAKNGKHALEILPTNKPDLILLDVMMPEMDGFDVAKKIREDDEFFNIPIVMFTAKAQVEDKISGLEAGADVYLTKPTQPRELFAQIKALLDRSQKIKATTLPKDGRRGFLVGTIAAKGGVGVSTTVINLGITIYRMTNQNSLIVDFHPGRGDISWEMGYTAQAGLSDLIDMQSSLITPEMIAHKLVIHDSGVKLLLASQSPKEADQIYQSETIKEITSKLPYVAQWIIMDLGANLLPATQTITKYCDCLVVVLSNDPIVIKQTRALIGDLISIGINETRIIPVLVNRYRSSQPETINLIENQLGYKIASFFTPAPELAHQAKISNNPMVVQQANNITAKQFIRLAELIAAKNSQWESYEASS